MSYAIGFITAFVAILGWGSNFVPVKKFPTGDGLYFQWVLASGVIITGLIVHCSRGFPTFEPWMMLGGVLWCTGNILTVPIVRLIGLGLGMLLWNLSCLAVGWAVTRFGFANVIKAQDVPQPILNYVGIVLVVVAACCYLFVEPETGSPTPEEHHKDPEKNMHTEHISPQESDGHLHVPMSQMSSASDRSHSQKALLEHKDSQGPEQPIWNSPPMTDKRFWNMHEIAHLKHQMLHFFHLEAHGLHDHPEHERKHDCLPRFDTKNMSPYQRRIVGALMALVAGAMYGVNVLPLQYLLDHSDNGKKHSENALDYVFPHFCGVYLCATFYFLIYCLLKRNKPEIYPHVTAPAFLSGAIWAIAQISFFVASSNLGLVIAFPLSTSGPGVVAALWSILLFKEIRGRRNLSILLFSFGVSFIAVILITLSKVL